MEQKNSKMRKVSYLRLQFWSRQSRADASLEHRPPQMLQQHGEFSSQHDLELSYTSEFTSIPNNTFTFTIYVDPSYTSAIASNIYIRTHLNPRHHLYFAGGRHSTAKRLSATIALPANHLLRVDILPHWRDEERG